MNLFEKILYFLQGEMTRPISYGWFHIMFLIIIALVTIFLCLKYKNADSKKVKKIILFFSLLSILLEIYKQLIFSFNYQNGIVSWKYQWYAFPYQFCSTPMYVGLLAFFAKNKKTENALISFLASYGLIAGILTMAYPESMFVRTIGINIQTMIHHGSMLALGLYLYINKKFESNYKSIIGASVVFSILVLIALTIDVSTYYTGLDNGLEMFYISPFHTSTLPILCNIYPKVPYIVFLLLYLGAFVGGTSLMLYLRIKEKVKK